MIRNLILAAACAVALGAVQPAAAVDDQMPLAKAGRTGGGFGSTDQISGVSGKLYLTERTALQATLGFWGWGWNRGYYGAYGYYGIGASVDFLLEQKPIVANNEVFGLNWYYGAGPVLGFGGSAGLLGGASGVLGLGFQLAQYPLDVVVEWRPTVMLLSTYEMTTGQRMRLGNASSAVRWWF